MVEIIHPMPKIDANSNSGDYPDIGPPNLTKLAMKGVFTSVGVDFLFKTNLLSNILLDFYFWRTSLFLEHLVHGCF